jgi:hypothetical protein
VQANPKSTAVQRIPVFDVRLEDKHVEAVAETLRSARRDPLRSILADRHGIQTTVLYPSINEFSAYAGRPGAGSPPAASVPPAASSRCRSTRISGRSAWIGSCAPSATG